VAHRRVDRALARLRPFRLGVAVPRVRRVPAAGGGPDDLLAAALSGVAGPLFPPRGQPPYERGRHWSRGGSGPHGTPTRAASQATAAAQSARLKSGRVPRRAVAGRRAAVGRARRARARRRGLLTGAAGGRGSTFRDTSAAQRYGA